jgi:hypothetical protein
MLCSIQTSGGRTGHSEKGGQILQRRAQALKVILLRDGQLRFCDARRWLTSTASVVMMRWN